MEKLNLEVISIVFDQSQNVCAVWTFGSAKDGVVRAGSDLDLGVLFFKKPSFDELTKLRKELTLALAFEDIDLVPLNEAPPLLAFEAISGKRLYCRDQGAKAEFVSRAAREYESENYLIERSLKS